jgi:hypothetical protein
MKTENQNRGATLLLVFVLLTSFAVAFHFGNKQRRVVAPIQDAATQFFRIALLPRAYAQANEGRWPALDDETRAFALPIEDLPRGYRIGPRFDHKITETPEGILLGSINNAGAYTLKPVDSIASDYIYFAYAVTNDVEFLSLVKSVRAGASLDANIAVEAGRGTLGSSTLYRLDNKLDAVLVSDGVVKPEQTDVLSRIPVLMERPRDGFAWVMYLNMKMERLPYPGAFPMSAAIIEALETPATAP